MARYQGRLIEWHDEQGYGFIEAISEAKHQPVFLHIKNFKRSGPRPIIGCVIEYDLAVDSQSRPQAINVSYVKMSHIRPHSHAARIQQQHNRVWHPMYILMLCYWVILFTLSAFSLLPALSLMMIMLINAYTYWLYYQDKQAALTNRYRTSEQHLLLMSVLGGWTAAWFAGQHFRHKTQKQPFQRYFYCAILGNILLMSFSVAVLRLATA